MKVAGSPRVKLPRGAGVCPAAALGYGRGQTRLPGGWGRCRGRGWSRAARGRCGAGAGVEAGAGVGLPRTGVGQLGPVQGSAGPPGSPRPRGRCAGPPLRPRPRPSARPFLRAESRELPPPPPPPRSAMPKHEFFVDMTCEGCSNAVTRVLHRLGGVQFDIDLPNKKVYIDSEHNVDTLLETLKKTGKNASYLGEKSAQ